jgi:hypothetical protein
MPRVMPALAASYDQHVQGTLQIVGSTEALWLTAPPASAIKRQLKVDRLEALYEAGFLRIFAAWENYLEEVLVHLLAGYRTPGYIPVAVPGSVLLTTLQSARAVLYGNHRFLLWHDPQIVSQRARTHLTGSPVEVEVAGQQARLEAIAAIRHRIAHSSRDSQSRFQAAALTITGAAPASSPGRMLRAANIADPLNPTKWIRVLSLELRDLAIRIIQ